MPSKTLDGWLMKWANKSIAAARHEAKVNADPQSTALQCCRAKAAYHRAAYECACFEATVNSTTK